MKITGENLIEMFYVSMVDDKMIEVIDTLGLEQPIIDEEYELYKSVSAKDPKNMGINLVFSECNECEDKTVPCLDVISWDSDKNIEVPFRLNFTLSYDEVCRVLGKKADYNSDLIDELKTWIIEIKDYPKYILNVMFKEVDFKDIISVVVSPFAIDKLDDTYIPNKD